MGERHTINNTGGFHRIVCHCGLQHRMAGMSAGGGDGKVWVFWYDDDVRVLGFVVGEFSGYGPIDVEVHDRKQMPDGPPLTHVIVDEINDWKDDE